ncbi:MAG: hypothetical protein QOH93_1467, partial [Chloroflexia bacterium]|nr:hypothetical protein [Chloroflexia bacterium]
MKAFISSLVVVVLAGVAALFLFPPLHTTSAQSASGPVSDQGAGKSGSAQGAATSVPTCAPSWVVVTSPNAVINGDQYYATNQLTGVSVVSPDDVWAVGYYNDPSVTQPGSSNKHVPRNSPNDKVQIIEPEGSGGTYRTLVEHYDGTGWTMVPSPNNGDDDNLLAAVVGIANDDVWAVGSYINGFGIAQTLTMHWDGEAWSLVDSPNVGPLLDNRLTAIDAAATGDVWAVGYYYNEAAIGQTLTMHWDGESWSIVDSPNEGERDNNLFAVTVIATNDVWAVGAYAESNGYAGVFKSLALHWNGVAWTVQDTPSVGSFTNILYGIDAAAPDDIWAVGVFSGSSGSRGLLLHWDGTAWTPVLGPSTGSTTEVLFAVKATASDDAWAVGQIGAYSNPASPVVIHWDGTEWRKARTPNLNQNEGGYIGYTALLS